jgi:filamentous hemagglutinin family protein
LSYPCLYTILVVIALGAGRDLQLRPKRLYLPNLGEVIMKLSISTYVIGLFICISLHAEITLDGTLGPRGALEGPDYAIGAELGQQHGGNLFHSFADFNININESATFFGPNNINNVINRVTGGNSSNIDGILRSTIPDADVYLINPAGILFGPNAILDIQGSFHASTADTLRFQDGGEFNARNPQNSLLTIAPISTFGFLTDSPQPLSVSGSVTEGSSKLAVPIGKALSLIGGNIKITGSSLTANSGRINIAGVAGQGDVTISPEDLVLSMEAGDVTLEDSTVSVSGIGGGGNVYIRAGQFIVDGAIVSNGTTYGTAGEINVRAKNLIASHGGRFISDSRGAGQGGKIKIKVEGSTEFAGDVVKSNDSVSVSGINIISRQYGDGGSIELETGSLNLKNGASINATTYSFGQSGNINIQATDSINLSGVGSQGQGSSIAANTQGQTENAGKGGTVVLEAKELHLADGALIGTVTSNSGASGEIKIKVSEGVVLAGKDKRGFTSSILTSSASSGDGGSIKLEAKQLSLFDGASILANSTGRTADAGNGGTIEIITGRLQLADGAQIATSTFGPGQGGKLTVKVANTATLSGQDQSENGFRSGLLTGSEGQMDDAGNGGTIVLVVGDLRLAENGEITAKTFGPGVGGNINIQAQTVKLTESSILASSDAQGDAGRVVLAIGDKLQMRNSSIETKAESADGGNLIITAPSYIYLVNSQITASVSEERGSGGNITLKPQFIILDNGEIFAKAKRGKGGNINIITTGIYSSRNKPIKDVINASSEFGVDGEVKINSPEVNLDELLVILPGGFIESAELPKPCQNEKVGELSTFRVNSQREGVPMAPAGFQE